MNCKYCGAALPTKGGTCPQCGRMIPMDQKKMMREMLDPRWNDYRDPNTAMYKEKRANDDNARLGKIIVVVIIIVLIIIAIAIANAG
jgi:uncharacterized membrane protein YvbJ